jgi:hypothetical protein
MKYAGSSTKEYPYGYNMKGKKLKSWQVNKNIKKYNI